MAYKSHDFLCEDCGHEFEEFYKKSERDQLRCPKCGSAELKTLISTANVATFSIMSPEMQRHSLMERSAKHTQKEIDKNPEKFGGAGLARRTKKIQV